MWKALMWLQKNLTWSIPLSMLAGLVFGQLVDPSLLRRAILPLTFLMVYPMMVAVNIQEVFHQIFGVNAYPRAVNNLGNINGDGHSFYSTISPVMLKLS